MHVTIGVNILMYAINKPVMAEHMVCNLLFYCRKKNISEVDLQFLVLVSLLFCKLVLLLRFLCSEGKYWCEGMTRSLVRDELKKRKLSRFCAQQMMLFIPLIQ
jgi:hypothetical protein